MKKDVNIIIGILALVVAGFIFGYKYISQSPAITATTAQTETSSGAESPTETSLEMPKVDMKVLLGDGTPSKGPLMAKVTVLEYLDPECEACKAFHPRVKKVLGEFDGKIRYMVRHMPYHGNSEDAIKALEAALEQNKYWEMLDLLFENQNEWGHKKDGVKTYFEKYAQKAGLDLAKFKKDILNPDYDERIKKDKKDGEFCGVSGTPSFFINGSLLTNLGEEPLREAIQKALQ